MPTNLFLATGDIRVSRFVKVDTAADNAVKEADANERTIGISQVGPKDPPGVTGSSALAASSGLPVQVFGLADVCLLTAGSGGWTRGDMLKSDADGNGVVAASTGTTVQWVGAIAMASAAEGDQCRVQVVSFPFRPALA